MNLFVELIQMIRVTAWIKIHIATNHVKSDSIKAGYVASLVYITFFLVNGVGTADCKVLDV